MVLSEYTDIYIYAHDFGTNLEKKKTPEVKGKYQKRKRIILWLRETVVQNPRPSCPLPYCHSSVERVFQVVKNIKKKYQLCARVR